MSEPPDSRVPPGPPAPPAAVPPRAASAEPDAATTIAMAAHELKNAMGGISMALARCDQVLLAGKPIGPPHLAAVRAELARLAALVNTWLDRARPPAAVPPPPDAVDLVDLVALAREVTSVFEATHGRAVGLAFEGEPARLIAAAPAEQVRAVLLNYLENARKYAPPPAGIELRISISPRRADRLCVAVVDDGPGIEPEHQARLFQPFVRVLRALRVLRAPDEREPGVDGLGLGLSICRAIASSLGGEVGVRSAPGRGATFWLDLPLP